MGQLDRGDREKSAESQNGSPPPRRLGHSWLVPATYGDENGRLIVDDRFPPLFITTWIGEPSETMVRAYYDEMATALEQAQRMGTRVVLATDAMMVDRPPSTIRKLVAELHDQQVERFEGPLIETNYVALGSAVIRGAITAVNWISNRGFPVEALPDMASALQAAVGRLTEEHLRVPASLDLANYRPPAAEKSA